jgi:hypothetical protein
MPHERRGTLYDIVGGKRRFYLHGFYNSPYSVPIGGLIDFAGS